MLWIETADGPLKFATIIWHFFCRGGKCSPYLIHLFVIINNKKMQFNFLVQVNGVINAAVCSVRSPVALGMTTSFWRERFSATPALCSTPFSSTASPAPFVDVYTSDRRRPIVPCCLLLPLRHALASAPLPLPPSPRGQDFGEDACTP